MIELDGAKPPAQNRDQAEARRVLAREFPYRCCAVCGLQLSAGLQISHLDHNATNNAAENLARLCPTHHVMYDSGLYPVEAIRLMQLWWQWTEGKPDHAPRMKDAGPKSAATRKLNQAMKAAEAAERRVGTDYIKRPRRQLLFEDQP